MKESMIIQNNVLQFFGLDLKNKDNVPIQEIISQVFRGKGAQCFQLILKWFREKNIEKGRNKAHETKRKQLVKNIGSSFYYNYYFQIIT